MATTRDATDIYYDLPTDPATVTFQQRFCKVTKTLPIKPFKRDKKISAECIYDFAKGIYQQLVWLKEDEACKLRKREPKARVDRAIKINQDRQLIATYLKMQYRLNLTKVSRLTGCTFAMVKKVHLDLLFQGVPETFVYNNLKKPEELAQIEETVQKVGGTYLTISDIKRQHAGFSMKWIRRRVRATGLRYRKMPRKRKVDKTVKPCPNKVFDVVSHLVQAIKDKDTEVFYIDEMHFPLFQTSDYFWTRPDQPTDLVYNRRPVSDAKLSAIAMCSLEKFYAVQIFKRDVTANDFLFFLQTALKKVGQGRRVTILADNASWHTSPTVLQNAAGKFLFFNVARLYQANAIETSFSFVRSDYRKRPLVDTLEKEAYLILDSFMRPENVQRFKGVKRNHLRSLIKLLEEAFPALLRIDSYN